MIAYVLILLSGVVATGLATPALAGAAPEDAIATLLQRGYASIEIIPGEAPGYEAKACKGGSRFAITMDAQTNIIDADPLGACDSEPRRYAAAPPPATEAPGMHKNEAYGQVEPGPATAHADIFDRLYRQGYYDIRVIDTDDDEIEVLACKKGRLYELEIKYDGRINDIDRKGRCDPRRHSGKNDVDVDAPFSGVRVGKGDVDVEAPFTGVHVGRGDVRIRAPFVDLRIPR